MAANRKQAASGPTSNLTDAILKYQLYPASNDILTYVIQRKLVTLHMAKQWLFCMYLCTMRYAPPLQPTCGLKRMCFIRENTK